MHIPGFYLSNWSQGNLLVILCHVLNLNKKNVKIVIPDKALAIQHLMNKSASFREYRDPWSSNYRRRTDLTRKDQEDSLGRRKVSQEPWIPWTTIEEAFPYDVPDFVPPILMVLSTHLNDCQVSKMTISGKLVYIYASWYMSFIFFPPGHLELWWWTRTNRVG